MAIYKVLPVPLYITVMKTAWFDSKDIFEDLYAMRFSVNNNVIFGRNGWYYNRITDFSWIEFQGTFLTHDKLASAFKQDLDLENYKPLPQPCLEAIRTLFIYGIKIPELDKMRYNDAYARMLRDSYRQAAYHPNRLMQKIKKFKKQKETKCQDS